MLTITEIKNLFNELNQELSAKQVVGEVGICGGAVMCLVFNARMATKDIDGIFSPSKEIREAVERVARNRGIDKDWLNDAAKGFFYTNPPKQDILHLSHLRVWAPQADYMLAMKAISARFDTHDKDDLIFLIHHLEYKSVEEIFETINKYYPKQNIPAKTQFLIEEILEQKK